MKNALIQAGLIFLAVTVAYAIAYDLLTGTPIGRVEGAFWSGWFFLIYFTILGVFFLPQLLPADEWGAVHAARSMLKSFTIGVMAAMGIVAVVGMAQHLGGIIDDQSVETTPTIIGQIVFLAVVGVATAYTIKSGPHWPRSQYWNEGDQVDYGPVEQPVHGEMDYSKHTNGWQSHGETFTPLAGVEMALLAFTDEKLKREGLTVHGTDEEIQLVVGIIQSMNELSAPENRLKIWNDVQITAETRRRVAEALEAYRRREAEKEQKAQHKTKARPEADHKRQRAKKPAPPPKTGVLAEALELFELEQPYTKADLKKRRKQLLAKTHPDAGGSAFLFKQVENAHEVLQRHTRD